MKTAKATNSIAILGGTFNPPHLGHVEPALEVINTLKLDKLGLMPCKIPPHKETAGVSEIHRFNMTKLMVDSNEKLYIEPIELSLPAPSYTVNTLSKLKARDPATRIHFLIGEDSLYNLESWYKWQHLLDYCHLIVMKRETKGCLLSASLQQWIEKRLVTSAEELRSTDMGKVYLANSELVTMSSTAIRQGIKHAQNERITGITDSVYEYIKQHNLYTDI